MTAIAFVAMFIAGMGVGAILTIVAAIWIDETRDERTHARALKNLRNAGIEYEIIDDQKTENK